MSELTEKQRKFVKFYEGNGVEAAERAGYKGSYAALGKTAHDLLKNPKIVAAIKNRQDKEERPLIASRQDRQLFWTEMMMNSAIEPKDRLKASELLGKSEGDFLDRVEAKLNFEKLSDDELKKLAKQAIEVINDTD